MEEETQSQRHKDLLLPIGGSGPGSERRKEMLEKYCGGSGWGKGGLGIAMKSQKDKGTGRSRGGN